MCKRNKNRKSRRKLDEFELIMRNYQELEIKLNSDDFPLGGFNPTQETAIDMAEGRVVFLDGTKVEDAEKWLLVAKETIKHFNKSRIKEFVELYFVLHLHPCSVMRRLFITKSTFYAWKGEVRTFFNLAACQTGVKKVF